MPRERPFKHNAAAEMQRRTQLDIAGLDRFAPSGRALSGGGALVGLNTGAPVSLGAMQLQYVRINNLVNCWFTTTVTSGMSGTLWGITLPCVATNRSEVNGLMGRWSASKAGPLEANGDVNQTIVAGVVYATFKYLSAQAVAPQQVGNAVPWVWSVGSTLRGAFSYIAADTYTGA